MNWTTDVRRSLFSRMVENMSETQKLLFRKRVEKQLCGESVVRLDEVHEAMRKDLSKVSK